MGLLETLHRCLTPLAAFGFGLWAAWLAFASDAETDLPRVLDDQLPPQAGRLSPSRGLYVAHLALLTLAGAAAGTAVSWWVWPPAEALLRLLLGVILVWVLGDILPRLLAAIAPELPGVARPLALQTLKVFGPLLRVVAWADRKGRAPSFRRDLENGPARRDMLLGLFSLADTTIAEIMTPRIDIVAVDASWTQEEVVGTLQRCEHARLVGLDGQPDSVIGVIYA